VLIKKLYETYAMGKLEEKRFELLCAEYEKEQAELEQLLASDFYRTGLRKSLSCKSITVSGYRSGRASDSTGTFFKDDKCGNAEAAGVRNFNSTAK